MSRPPSSPLTRAPAPPRRRPNTPPKRGQAANQDGRWKPAFLAALAETGNVTESARRARTSRKTAQNHHKTDRDFADAWADAIDEYSDAVETEADRRGVHGVEELILYNGAPVFVPVDRHGQVRPPGPGGKVPRGCRLVAVVKRRCSDALLLARLRALRPERYRERFQLAHNREDHRPRTPDEQAAEADALLASIRETLGINEPPTAEKVA